MSRCCCSSGQGWAAAAATVPNRGVRTSAKPALPEPEMLGSLLSASSGEGAAHPREGQPRRSAFGCRSRSLLSGDNSSASTAGEGQGQSTPFCPARRGEGRGFLKPLAVWASASFPSSGADARKTRTPAGGTPTRLLRSSSFTSQDKHEPPRPPAPGDGRPEEGAEASLAEQTELPGLGVFPFHTCPLTWWWTDPLSSGSLFTAKTDSRNSFTASLSDVSCVHTLVPSDCILLSLELTSCS